MLYTHSLFPEEAITDSSHCPESRQWQKVSAIQSDPTGLSLPILVFTGSGCQE
jgi:hypothetical protein